MAISYVNWSAAFTNSTHSDRDIFFQSPLLSAAPDLCMDTADFINVEVWVCYSFSKHNIFCTKTKESFVVVWIVEEILKTGNAFLQLDFPKLSHFCFVHKDNANGRGEVVEVLYCYYSRDSREIVQKFPCIEVAMFSDCNQTFWDVSEGLEWKRCISVGNVLVCDIIFFPIRSCGMLNFYW